MGNEVRIRATADDQVSGKFDKIRDKVDLLGKSEGVKVLATGFGLGVGAKVAAFGIGLVEGALQSVGSVLGDSIHKAQENEVAYSRLTAALKANVPAWNGNIAAIKEANEAGAKLGFTDDEMANSLAALVGATHDVAKAEAIRATAMDLARFKGISLGDATDALTKVDAGSYRILKSLGIQLKANATQTQALAAVQRVAGGQAAAYATTAAGAQAKLNATIDEAEEKIGGALLPVIASLASTIADDVIPAGEKFVGTLGDIAKGAQDAAGPLARMNDVLTGGRSPIDDLHHGLETLGEPLKAFNNLFAETGYQLDAVSGKAHTQAAEFRHLQDSAGGVPKDMGRLEKSAVYAGKALDDLGGRTAKVSDGIGKDTKEAADLAEKNLGRLHEIAINAHDRMIKDFNAKDPLKKLGYANALAFADGLLSGQQDVESGAAALVSAMKHPISGAKRIAKLEGELTGPALAKGLKSGDPLVRAAAEKYKAYVEHELALLRAASKTYGQNTGKAFGDGLAAEAAYVKGRAQAMLAGARGVMEAFSPPGPESPLHDIDKWGRKTGEAYVDGMAQGLGGLKHMAGRGLSGLTLPGMSGSAAGSPVFAAAGGRSEAHLHIHLDGGMVTAGAGRALAAEIGPHVAKWFHDKGVLPRLATGHSS